MGFGSWVKRQAKWVGSEVIKAATVRLVQVITGSKRDRPKGSYTAAQEVHRRVKKGKG